MDTTFLGDVFFKERLSACNTWKVADVSSTYRGIIESEIPTLLLSGPHDPIAPPATAKKLSKYLTNSRHIIIPYMGHMFSDLSNLDCYDNYVVAFFSGTESKLDLNCFQEMKPMKFKTTTDKVQNEDVL